MDRSLVSGVRPWIAAAAVLCAACGEKMTGSPTPDLGPTGVLRLSPGNDGGKDEDPHVLRTVAGDFYAAWLSDRDGNDEIYVCGSPSGMEWTPPTRATTHGDADWYPSLAEAAGAYHLVWMRQQVAPPYERHVWYNRSPDALAWSPANEVALTSGAVDDFVPFMVELHGTLFVYFDSQARSANGTRDLYQVRSTDAGSTWTDPAPLDDLNDATEMDSFPFAMRNVLGGLTMVWIRYDASASGAVPYLHESSDVFWSASPDGIDWGAPQALTANDADGIVDSIPSLYGSLEETYFVWTSNLVDRARGDVVELAFSRRAEYPAAVINVSAGNQAPGWSARVVPAEQGGLFLRVWVATISGSKKVHYQLFER
jgi:hypothetical protein